MRIRYSLQAAETLRALRNDGPIVETLADQIRREGLTLDQALVKFGRALREADY